MSLESGYQFPFRSLRIELVKVASALLLMNSSVAQNVISDDQYLLRGGDDGLLLALAGGATVKLSCEKAVVLVRDSPCRLHQSPA